MADRTITVDLIGRDKSLSSSLDKSGKAATRTSKTLSTIGKVAGGALKVGMVAGAVGVGLVTKFLVNGVRAAVDYQTLALKTAAVIKSTGNVANISVKGIQALASSLESMSGVDETLIINSQNVLATFTNIRNVGKNRIFDQATKSTLDMSVALKEDLQSATIQVGKALNDPIKGITALSRVGVSFTADQKKVISQMVKTGDTIGAQKVILGELNKEFGGAAKAAGSGFAGSLARAKDAIDDAGRAVGQALLPMLTDLVKNFAKAIPKAIAATKSAWKDFVSGYNGSKLSNSGLNTFGASMKALQQQLDATKSGFDGSGTAAFSFGDKLKQIPAGFGYFAAAAVSAFNHIKTGFQEAGLKIQYAAINTALKVDEAFGHLPGSVGKHFRELAAAGKRSLDDVQSKLNGVKTTKLKQTIADAELQLAQLNAKKSTPKIEAQKRQFDRVISAARKELASLHDVHLSVTTTFYQVGKGPGTYGQGKGVLAGGQKRKAKGGPVMKGQPYIVGEERPELFVPNSDGTIVPKVPAAGTGAGSAWGGGGMTVNVYVTQPLGTARQIASAVTGALNEAKAGGYRVPAGTFATA